MDETGQPDVHAHALHLIRVAVLDEALVVAGDGDEEEDGSDVLKAAASKEGEM
jgi:hypothetical protein